MLHLILSIWFVIFGMFSIVLYNVFFIRETPLDSFVWLELHSLQLKYCQIICVYTRDQTCDCLVLMQIQAILSFKESMVSITSEFRPDT